MNVLLAVGSLILAVVAVWLAFACSERPFPWSDER